MGNIRNQLNQFTKTSAWIKRGVLPLALWVKKNNRKTKSRKSIIYGTPIYKYQTVVKVNR